MINWWLLCIFLILSFLLTGAFIRYAIEAGLMDKPNERSSHTIPTPRGGGIIFVCLWLLFSLYQWFVLQKTMLSPIIPGAIIVAITAYIDDHFSICARWRLLIYTGAASLTVYNVGGFPVLHVFHYAIHLGGWGSVLAILAIVWSTNLYNFMDGIDGMAGVEALTVFGVGAVLFYLAGSNTIMTNLLSLVSLIVGFLCWNWPRAWVFMGDVGSAFLGFLVVPFAIMGENQFKIPLLLWLLPYSVFYMDTTITLIRRFIRGERVMEAHKAHAYQLLHQAGWSHQRIIVAVFIMNILLGLMTLYAHVQPSCLLPFLMISWLSLGIIYYLICRHLQSIAAKS